MREPVIVHRSDPSMPEMSYDDMVKAGMIPSDLREQLEAARERGETYFEWSPSEHEDC